MEIATNFWDEMGNGNFAEVHTHLFNNIFKVFDISATMERSLTANALLSETWRSCCAATAGTTRRPSGSSA